MERSNSQSGSCMAQPCGPVAALYTNFFFSSWGDRMWNFAIGLYLVYFDSGSLRLAAIYGFSSAGSVLFLGSVIGHWVDTTTRMTVVTVSLLIQNTSVILCATVVCLVLWYEDTEKERELHQLAVAAVMLFGIIARLASVAYKISITRDWVVVVSQGSKGKLANLNAVMQSIDLGCKVLAPTVVGQVMTFASLFVASTVIAGWNVFSFILEYSLLRRVYRLVPRLGYKEGVNSYKVQRSVASSTGGETDTLQQSVASNGQQSAAEKDTKPEKRSSRADIMEAVKSGSYSSLRHHPDNPDDDVFGNEGAAGPQRHRVGESFRASSEWDRSIVKKDEKEGCRHCCQLMFKHFMILFGGWRTYAKQDVVFAGISLAFLYMTVLGFDSITVGYIYAQGLSESLLGVAAGLAGLMGMLGTFLFTRFRRCVGLNHTGIIAFIAEISCLILAVVSIWTPGSPFNPKVLTSEASTSIPVCNVTLNETTSGSTSGSYVAVQDSTLSSVNQSLADGEAPAVCDDGHRVYTSVILFLVGLVLSRVGLWMADLSVTQLQQEYVLETERGTVNGVQNSMNMLLDMVKFILVVILPSTETFGILILLSFAFICSGAGFFVIHVCQTGKSGADEQPEEQDEPA